MGADGAFKWRFNNKDGTSAAQQSAFSEANPEVSLQQYAYAVLGKWIEGHTLEVRLWRTTPRATYVIIIDGG